jgi:hypothetical protein
MGIHTFPKDGYSYEQVCQLATAAQQDTTVKGYRSFLNLTDGRAVCILEGPDKESVATWFRTMNIPTDAVCEVEIEGDRGTMTDLRELAGTAAAVQI